MAINRWNPSQIVSRQEKFILGRLKRNGKLYAFLRQHRHQLFDDAFQHELEAMYGTLAGTGSPERAGKGDCVKRLEIRDCRKWRVMGMSALAVTILVAARGAWAQTVPPDPDVACTISTSTING
jgi:hypothetical protein